MTSLAPEHRSFIGLFTSHQSCLAAYAEHVNQSLDELHAASITSARCRCKPENEHDKWCGGYYIKRTWMQRVDISDAERGEEPGSRHVQAENYEALTSAHADGSMPARGALSASTYRAIVDKLEGRQRRCTVRGHELIADELFSVHAEREHRQNASATKQAT